MTELRPWVWCLPFFGTRCRYASKAVSKQGVALTRHSRAVSAAGSATRPARRLPTAHVCYRRQQTTDGRQRRQTTACTIQLLYWLIKRASNKSTFIVFWNIKKTYMKLVNESIGAVKLIKWFKQNYCRSQEANESSATNRVSRPGWKLDCMRERSSNLKGIVQTHGLTHRHTQSGLIALAGPLRWPVFKRKIRVRRPKDVNSMSQDCRPMFQRRRVRRCRTTDRWTRE